MSTLKERTEQLNKAYEAFTNELYGKYPQFKTDNYSCPYYISIPDGWFESGNRILIIGEEGAGDKPSGSTEFDVALEYMQKFNEEYLYDQLNKGQYGYGINYSPFWRRFRRIIDLKKNTSVAWTNIDKIHRLNIDSKRFRISQKERKSLHSLDCRILKKEIEILKPTLLVFFGWYWVSLEHELKDAYNELCKSNWKNNVVSLEIDGIPTVFSYHPSFRTREYENTVINNVSKLLK